MNGEGGWHRSVTGVIRRTLEAAFDDNIPFLASALAFDILLTAIPFAGLVLAAVGYLVQHQITTHQVEVHDLLQRFLPAVGGGPGTDAYARAEDALSQLVAQRGRLTLVATPLFLWFSTRLFGGLRAALNDVFDTDERRPWPMAKLLDLAMVIGTGVLLVANAWLSAIGGGNAAFLARFGAELGALVFGTLLFFAIFKFLPSRRIHWRTGLVASLFCAVGFEVAKRLYALYVLRFATLDRFASGANGVGLLLFLLWVYYTAYVFLLGGEVAETYDLMRMRKLQRVRLG